MYKGKKIAVLLLSAALFIGGIFCIHATAADNSKQLDIMFLHDTHSHLNEFTTVENGQSMTLGGFA